MRAGIVIDSWKRSIFERHLTVAGHEFGVGPGPVKDTLTIFVDVDDPMVLAPTVLAANTEAARTGPPNQ